MMCAIWNACSHIHEISLSLIPLLLRKKIKVVFNVRIAKANMQCNIIKESASLRFISSIFPVLNLKLQWYDDDEEEVKMAQFHLLLDLITFLSFGLTDVGEWARL